MNNIFFKNEVVIKKPKKNFLKKQNKKIRMNIKNEKKNENKKMERLN